MTTRIDRIIGAMRHLNKTEMVELKERFDEEFGGTKPTPTPTTTTTPTPTFGKKPLIQKEDEEDAVPSPHKAR